MLEPIDRQAAIKLLNEMQDKAATGIEDVTLYRAIKVLREMPTIKPEVQRGRWIFGHSRTSSWMTCSICCKAQSGQTACFSYCPNCGAEMREEAEQE